MSLKLIALTALGIVPLIGCGSTPTARRYDDVLSGRSRRIGVEIEGSVARACHIDPARTYFDYNSEVIDDDGQAVLNDVAECMKTGPLHGRAILVTGYTDATGTRVYNKELGLSRSEAVANELFTMGISPSRIYLRSRGERDASDTSGPNAYDRKVELSLVERDS